MGLASAIPLRLDAGISRALTPLPRTLAPNLSNRHVSFFTSHSSVGRNYYGLRWYRTQEFKCTEKDESLVTEEMLKTNPHSHDKTEEAKKAVADSSGGKHDLSARRASSIRNVALWVSAAVTFGIALGFKEGAEKASEFFAGYLLEQSLSVDNLFVFVLIFKYFKVPGQYQNRVLSYGIAGAIIFRAIMILIGTATLQRFEAVNLLLASILLYSSYKLFASEEEDSDLDDNFIVKTCQKFIPVTAYYDGDRFLTIQEGVWKATPLLLTVAVIELSDIAFAIDSIPAVFGVTRDPFIVFTSNLFAISGLRSLFILISESMSELEYLQPSIGVVLGFIGTKMVIDFFGYHISTEVSLGVVATSLGAGVLLSLLKNLIDERERGKLYWQRIQVTTTRSLRLPQPSAWVWCFVDGEVFCIIFRFVSLVVFTAVDAKWISI